MSWLTEFLAFRGLGHSGIEIVLSDPVGVLSGIAAAREIRGNYEELSRSCRGDCDCFPVSRFKDALDFLILCVRRENLLVCTINMFIKIPLGNLEFSNDIFLSSVYLKIYTDNDESDHLWCNKF